MRTYFYSEGKEKHGPLSFDELKQKNISKKTLIWFQGLDDWKLASEIDEMKAILELQPPQIIIADTKESNKPEEDALKITEKIESQTRKNNKRMFSNPFSFNGRIRRTEFSISIIIYLVVATFVNAIVNSGKAPIIGLAYIPMIWFMWAQGAKRCHDVSNNGWWQIIPFYIFWLLFQNGHPGFNEYGDNPKD